MKRRSFTVDEFRKIKHKSGFCRVFLKLKVFEINFPEFVCLPVIKPYSNLRFAYLSWVCWRRFCCAFRLATDWNIGVGQTVLESMIRSKEKVTFYVDVKKCLGDISRQTCWNIKKPSTLSLKHMVLFLFMCTIRVLNSC